VATQAERTAKTTERLLEATVASLIERGYRGTSTPEVCRRAGLSRGAQLHHYPTKEALVAAAVEHLLSMRMIELQERLARAPAGLVDLEDVMGFVWSVYTGETYYAWLELLVAARTDDALRAIMARLDAKLVARAERLVHRFLLPYVSDEEEVQATTRLIFAIFDGLAAHQILAGDDRIAKRALRVAMRAGLFTPKGGTSE
jgi:AcrR family transcriptional regulator